MSEKSSGDDFFGFGPKTGFCSHSTFLCLISRVRSLGRRGGSVLATFLTLFRRQEFDSLAFV